MIDIIIGILFILFGAYIYSRSARLSEDVLIHTKSTGFILAIVWIIAGVIIVRLGSEEIEKQKIKCEQKFQLDYKKAQECLDFHKDW